MVLHSSLRQHFSTNCGCPNSNHFKTSLRFGLSFAQSIPCWPKHALSNAVYPTPNEKAIMGVDLYNRTRKILNEQSAHTSRPDLPYHHSQSIHPTATNRVLNRLGNLHYNRQKKIMLSLRSERNQRYKESCSISVLSDWKAIPISMRPNTAMQPTCSVWPILALGSSRSSFPV